jgi:Family of unknown function (DUF5336)
MTFPTGGPPPTPAKPAANPELDRTLYLATAGLSVVIPLVCFTPFAPGVSLYATALGWVPALYLVAGLLSAQILVPGNTAKPGLLPAVVAVAATLPLLFTVLASGATAWGAWIVLVLGILEAGAVVGGYLFEAGLITPPAPKPFQAPQPGQWSPQTGGFPQPQQGQPGPFGGFGAPQQQGPGGFGQPVPPQQAPAPQPTQFMSHPGQFSTPAPPPSTPPSGFGAPPQS